MTTHGVSTKLLKIIYAATVPLAGVPGAIMLLAPEKMVPAGFDPVSTGVAGSVTLTFGVLAVFGFRAPLKFLPILLMQMIYKSLWLAVVAIPLFIEGTFPSDSIPMLVIFVAYIVANGYAIPFRVLLSTAGTE